MSGIDWYAARAAGVVAYALLTSGVLLGVLLDRYAHVSVTTLVLPGATSYRPFWVALGTIALELLLAVALANVLRKRIGHMRWRRVHYLTFGVWFASTMHGIGAGTDASAGWLRGLYLFSIGSVALATMWRVTRPALTPARAPVRRARD